MGSFLYTALSRAPSRDELFFFGDTWTLFVEENFPSFPVACGGLQYVGDVHGHVTCIYSHVKACTSGPSRLWKIAEDNATFLHPSRASIRVRLNGDSLKRIPIRNAQPGQGRPLLPDSISATVAWIRRSKVCSSSPRISPWRRVWSPYLSIIINPLAQHRTPRGVDVILRSVETSAYFSTGQKDTTENPRSFVLSARRTNSSLYARILWGRGRATPGRARAAHGTFVPFSLLPRTLYE